MLKVLITSGASREPIDDVRFVTNLSSGKTGADLASALASQGAEVTLLHGEGARVPSEEIVEKEVFGSAVDLEAKLRARLQPDGYDAVIMCAAVADYRPDLATKGKIRSDAEQLTLRLVRNPKILPRIKSFSARPLVVVGFKLTATPKKEERRAAVLAQYAGGGVDAVIQNDLNEIRSGIVHPFFLYRDASHAPEKIYGASGLALALVPLIQRRLASL
jgi:phosphopantothenate---cysteine ligase (CTP)